MYPKNVSVTSEVDGVAVEGYGTYYIRDYAGATMTSPFNGIHCGDGWHRPCFNPMPITDEQIVKSSKIDLIDGYKECLKIINRIKTNKEEIKQLFFEVKFEKSSMQARLEDMQNNKRLLKEKYKNGQLNQKEYQQLVNTLNKEKSFLQISINDCFKNIYEKKFGETIIKNLEETIQILTDYVNKENEK